MSQVGLASSNSRLRLRLYPGVLTVVWPPSSVDDDNSYHAFALIIAMRFVDSGCLWFTVPLKTPSSPVSIDVASMYRTVTVSDPCVITAQLCGFMPGTPKGLIVVETATIMADDGSDADEGDVEDLLCRRLNLNFPSGSFLFPSLSDECIDKLAAYLHMNCSSPRMRNGLKSTHKKN